MNIFKWITYIEDLCNDLMENTKSEILSEIQALRRDQEKRNESLAKEKNEIVNRALGRLTNDLNTKIDEVEEEFQEELDNIREEYNNQKGKLQNKVLEKIGLGF
ncbi:MAG: hypothetical protein R6U96_09430 [Promethearchaeia archaeon]